MKCLFVVLLATLIAAVAWARIKKWTWIEIGVYIWGGVTVLLAIFFLVVVFFGSRYLDEKGKFISGAAPKHIYQLYHAAKDHGNLVSGVIGFSALAWSYFFISVHPQRR